MFILECVSVGTIHETIFFRKEWNCWKWWPNRVILKVLKCEYGMWRTTSFIVSVHLERCGSLSEKLPRLVSLKEKLWRTSAQGYTTLIREYFFSHHLFHLDTLYLSKATSTDGIAFLVPIICVIMAARKLDIFNTCDCSISVRKGGGDAGTTGACQSVAWF